MRSDNGGIQRVIKRNVTYIPTLYRHSCALSLIGMRRIIFFNKVSCYVPVWISLRAFIGDLCMILMYNVSLPLLISIHYMIIRTRDQICRVRNDVASFRQRSYCLRMYRAIRVGTCGECKSETRNLRTLQDDDARREKTCLVSQKISTLKSCTTRRYLLRVSKIFIIFLLYHT